MELNKYKTRIVDLGKERWSEIDAVLEEAVLDDDIGGSGMDQLNDLADDIFYGRIKPPTTKNAFEDYPELAACLLHGAHHWKVDGGSSWNKALAEINNVCAELTKLKAPYVPIKDTDEWCPNCKANVNHQTWDKIKGLQSHGNEFILEMVYCEKCKHVLEQGVYFDNY